MVQTEVTALSTAKFLLLRRLAFVIQDTVVSITQLAWNELCPVEAEDEEEEEL